MFALGRPFAATLVYVAAASTGRWLLAVIAMVVLYISAIGTLHDLMHRNLGLTARANDLWLFALGVLLGESGHSLQATHREHHRKSSLADDPEGYVDGLRPWRVILEGPLYRHNLACWAWAHRPAIRRWIAAEATLSLAVISAAVSFGLQVPVFGAFVAATVLFSWVFPLVSVTWLHGDFGAPGLFGTKTIRGMLLPKLTLGLTYHLEHHLYPSVPTHQLAALSRRIEPELLAIGAEPDYLF